MTDYLLIGWKQIHEELFCDKDGEPVIKIDTFMKKYRQDMKEKGIVWKWTRGRGKERRLHNIVGWKNSELFYQKTAEDDGTR
jgi:hypothetical protein